MDMNKERKGPQRMPEKNEGIGIDLMDLTILSTPRPQASSTVERRTFGARMQGNNLMSDLRRGYEPAENNSSISGKTSDTSLGILDNISSFLSDPGASPSNHNANFENVTDEREWARKLLQRCSQIHSPNSVTDANKENNANSPNLSRDQTPSTLIDSGQTFNLTPSIEQQSKDQSTLRTPVAKGSTTSLNFEPNEITARSSAMSKSNEANETKSMIQSNVGISFDTTTAELMAQFDNEEFQSGSRMVSQMLADELSWQQNCSYALPISTSTEKEHLNLSCFSGIIGEHDLSIESRGGRKVSVGEFFIRKCGNIGQLSNVDQHCERPSFGCDIKSPKREKMHAPLVDVTTMTEDSTTDLPNDQNRNVSTSSADDTKEQSMWSLSRIAQILQDNDETTPRRLVDQLLNHHKQRKRSLLKQPENLTSDTYTLLMPSSRSSLPVCPTSEIKQFDKDIGSLPRNTKLSLDSKTRVDATPLLYHKISRDSSGSDKFENVRDSQVSSITSDALSEQLRKRGSGVANATNSQLQKNIDIENYSPVMQTLGQSLKNLATKDVLADYDESQNKNSKYLRDIQPMQRINQSQIKKEEVSAQRSTLEASVLNDKSNTQNSRNCSNDNIGIGSSTQELHNCVVGARREVDVELVNKSHRWVLCALKYEIIQGDKENIELQIPQQMILMPDACNIVKVAVKIIKNGKPLVVALKVEMSDMTTHSAWQRQQILCFVPEEPHVILSTQSGKDELDFRNIKDRSNKRLPVTIENKNNVDIALKLSIADNEHRSFRIDYSDEHQNGEGSRCNDFVCLVLKPSEQFTAVIRYNGTSDNDQKKKETTNVAAKLTLYIDNHGEDCVLIKELSLHGYSSSKASLPPERSGDYLRCDTPQHLAITSSPTSPQSSTSNRSGISGRNSPLSTVFSGGTVADDVIPIRATHSALVWNSVKVGTHDIKEFTIRNTSSNKIKLQATVIDSDNSFKFVRERQQLAAQTVVSLQRMESRTFSIVFGPNNPGALAGKIVFKHYEPKRSTGESRPSRVIFLYGYGGTGNVKISEAFKDTGGRMWLSLGSLNAGRSLDAKIKLHNAGDLRAYAKVKLTPKAVYPAMVSSWHVDPTELLLGPKEVQWVNLEFRPRKEDIALLQRANVSHVGTLTITHGDEPTRLRIRRLYKKLNETGQMSGKESEAFRNVVYPICKVFPGEMSIPNLNVIRDSVENLGDLCRGVRQHEVMLTMEVNADESMSILHDNADESQMFYSLCSDDSIVFPATEESFMPSDTLAERTMTAARIYEDDFTVSPSVVTLKPPSVNEATVMIMSSSNVAQAFETQVSHSDYLRVVPTEGMIPTKRAFPLRIQCKKRLDRNLEAVLQVYLENGKRDVLIKVMYG